MLSTTILIGTLRIKIYCYPYTNTLQEARYHYFQNTAIKSKTKIKVKKDCLWKQRTTQNHENQRLCLIESLHKHTVVYEAAYTS